VAGVNSCTCFAICTKPLQQAQAEKGGHASSCSSSPEEDCKVSWQSLVGQQGKRHPVTTIKAKNKASPCFIIAKLNESRIHTGSEADKPAGKKKLHSLGYKNSPGIYQ
jgi:hypothetical protein